MMSNEFTAALRYLIRNLNASTDFYRQARIDIDDHSQSDQLQSLAKLHENCAAKLQPYMISSQGEQENGRGLAIEWRKYLTHALTILKRQPRQAYYPRIASVENDTLQALDKAIAYSSHKVITDQLQTMRNELIAHYNAVLTTQRKIAA